MYVGTASLINYGYNELVEYDVTWQSGGDAVQKRADTPLAFGAYDIGTQDESLDINGWFNEGG